MILIFGSYKNLSKVYSITILVVSSSTTKKLYSFFIFFSPIPVNKKPVTVS